MIEFKRFGDVMVFECPEFKIEVAGNGAERIAINEAAANDPRAKEIITDAFEVLNMMIEHKTRKTRGLKVAEMNIKVNVDTKDAEEAIRKLNEYVWKHAPAENMPGHRFREFMKKEGL